VIKTPYISEITTNVVRGFPRLAGALLQTPAQIQFFSHHTLEMLLRENVFDYLDWLPSRSMRSRPAIRTVKN
jgi:hypothetical protein